MENNSDRMGFALIALSVIAFVLLAVNGPLKSTVDGFFNGFNKWQTATVNGISETNKQDVTHTAYSWSSDGTDGFTTTKPNLNLVNGTSEPFTMVYGIPDTVWNANTKRTGISLPTKILNGEVLPLDTFNCAVTPGSTYTQSIYVSTDAPLTGVAVGVTWFTPHNGHNIAGKTDISNISKNIYRITSTYTWPASSTDNYLRTFDIANLTNVFDFTKGTFLYFYQPKFELGSTSTPYMPSASEVKPSDQPKYIGTYVDKNDSASQEPSKYTWKLNPEYHE